MNYFETNLKSTILLSNICKLSRVQLESSATKDSIEETSDAKAFDLAIVCIALVPVMADILLIPFATAVSSLKWKIIELVA